MKTALQEADEAEEEGKMVRRDAKGREILSDEEKVRRDEKKRKSDEEASCPVIPSQRLANNQTESQSP